jgi:endonuclease-8
VVQYNGPILTLMRDSRLRFDPYLRRLGPDVLAKELDWPAILIRLRNDDPTRPVGDAIMDQRTLAGIGNLWKNETLYACKINPWRPTSAVTDEELEQIITVARRMMLREVRRGGHHLRGVQMVTGGDYHRVDRRIVEDLPLVARGIGEPEACRGRFPSVSE